MDTENSVGKAWAGAGVRWGPGQRRKKWGTSAILTKIHFKKEKIHFLHDLSRPSLGTGDTVMDKVDVIIPTTGFSLCETRKG